MKKIFFLFITGLTVSVSFSQEVSDAMRYAQDNITGTARFRAMSGAFGALGGDLSSLTVNPAGSAIFTNNQAGITFSNQNIKNNSNYFGTQTSDKENSFLLNQAGAVFVFNDHNPNNNWKKIAIGATYENTNNFNNEVFSAGINPRNSIDGYFLDYANYSNGGSPVPHELVNLANNETLTDLYQYLGSTLPNSQYPNLSGFSAQQALLGYQAYLINIDDPNNANSTYSTNNAPDGKNYYQENEIYTRGYNSKISFNIATSYKDRFYFGANLNAHITDYRRTSSFYEENKNPLQTYETVSNVRFNNELYTYGNGFSFQLGAIGKVTESFRLGIAYESNTWYNLYDELSQSLFTTTETNKESFNNNANPNVINVYESYTLQTPDKFTFSGAYVFGKSGLISVDYSIKNYGNTKYKPTNNPGFKGLNTDMSNQLTSNGELRVGAEYKIERLSLRGGYRYEGSPYKNKTTIGDLNSYSAGLGYSFGGTKIDLAYSYLERKSNQGFFATGFTDGANIQSKLNNVTMTLLFEL
ncbi:hypothetical protein BD847_2864 [Flavobacterium cutihirudinis]|uniref:Outer membrane protein transport protein (OMPP1/FadL/TodX) n=1 Tax=Flavobacterium cutihirudinis TaxID=1265740 RepID=A0A3D9FV18_9FLAO|nr:transporter [Flavobacterium cutihirudinis]RED23794.1 hypothetical protein BD847_2864 [Flavobacterium cutihirudinis]